MTSKTPSNLQDSSPTNSPPSSSPAKQLPPISDSPWFWVYLFGIMALAALAILGPKIALRQQQDEGKYHARQGMPEELRDKVNISPQSLSPAEADANNLVRLTWLYYLFGGVVVISWGMLWWQRFRLRRNTPKTVTHSPAALTTPVPTQGKSP